MDLELDNLERPTCDKPEETNKQKIWAGEARKN